MFRRKKNTFLLETLLPNDGGTKDGNTDYKRQLPLEATNNLSSVSALYVYTGTPPHGYGSQAPKVAETVIRSEEYNRKKDTKREISIGGVMISRLQWEEKDGDFPHDKVHGNYITSVVREMCEKTLIDHYAHIDFVVEKIMNNIVNTSSDILTQGRQTFCPLREQSVTAAQAYESAFAFLSANTGRDCYGFLDWIVAILECFEKETLVANKSVETVEKKKILDPVTKQHHYVEVKVMKMKSITINGLANTRKFMQQLVGRFASYIKHKERGKKDRRAIASATMFLRPFLYVIEAFHLSLSKELPGSTISIGGEEKKAKITCNMDINLLDTDFASHICQGTEDATKWNECLSPAIFYLMHYYFFSSSTRLSCKLPSVNKMGELFLTICKYGHLFQAWKEIQLGPGPLINNKKHYCRTEWKDDHMKYMNEQTRGWYIKIKDKITDDRKYVRSSPGMLMGMLNAASTTIGLLPANYKMERNKRKVICMRSSDDSTTKYLACNAEENIKCVIQNKQNLSLAGINLSPDKTFFLPEGIAEYTSWYIDGKFVSQYGTEVPSIRPQGKSPYDDLYAVAKGTSTLLQTLTINHLGASCRIRLGVAACKKVWRSPETGSNPRPGVSLKVQLIEDGGLCLWNSTNCHLNEIAMKKRLIKTKEEKEYIYRIMNPENPFSESIDEDMTYSKEHGCITVDTVDSPNCIFRYCKRSNRNFRGKQQEAQAKKEKANSAVYNLLNKADPTISLEFPTTSVSMKDHLISLLSTMRNRIALSGSEEEKYTKALSILEHGHQSSNEEDGDFWEREENYE